MAISLKHAFTSAKANGPDATKVQPSNWNAEHDITMATARILGRKTASAGVVEELTADDVYDLLGLPGGTRMLFQQTAAPTGWTKDTTHNNKALRVVSGSVSSGGATAFTSVFGSGKVTGSHVITQANLPVLNLSLASLTGSVGTAINVTNGTNAGRNLSKRNDLAATGGQDAVENFTESSITAALASGAVAFGGTLPLGGSGSGHDHTLSLDLQYVDIIFAQKD